VVVLQPDARDPAIGDGVGDESQASPDDAVAALTFLPTEHR